MLTIRLENELERELEKLAEQTGRTKAYFVREAIKNYLEDRSEYLLALKRLEAAGPRVSLEDVERELGLAR
jgi:RHH-type rel operon transcriptional repressor/antitoxin RelB